MVSIFPCPPVGCNRADCRIRLRRSCFRLTDGQRHPGVIRADIPSPQGDFRGQPAVQRLPLSAEPDQERCQVYRQRGGRHVRMSVAVFRHRDILRQVVRSGIVREQAGVTLAPARRGSLGTGVGVSPRRGFRPVVPVGRCPAAPRRLIVPFLVLTPPDL
ncbi:MAG: hypothetical protein WD603_00855 [Patescibacteria group bacterium]